MNLGIKILSTVLGLGVIGSLVGMGTFASFTATATNPGNTFSTGTLTLDTIQGGSSVAGSSFISLSGMKPGDSKTMLLEVKNTGSLNLQNLRLATSASTSSLLDSDGTNGLQVAILRCSQAYTGSGLAATCDGTETTAWSSRAIIQPATAIPSTTLSGGGSNFYKVTISLPTSAGNTFQGLSSTVVFTWTGEQTSGTAS